MTDTNLIEIFCIFDDFCKYFTPELKKHTLQVPGKRHRNHASRMSDSEIMTILVLFHTHRFRDLKSFYLGYICQHMRGDFPHQSEPLRDALCGQYSFGDQDKEEHEELTDEPI